jgi:hypothetical protein
LADAARYASAEAIPDGVTEYAMTSEPRLSWMMTMRLDATRRRAAMSVMRAASSRDVVVAFDSSGAN